MVNNTVKEDNEMSLKDVLLKIHKWYKFLLTKWKIIFISSIIFGAIGFLYATSKKANYIATLSFAMEDNKTGGALSAYSGLASQFGLDMGSGGGAFSGDNIIELMKSRSMVEKALLTPVNIQGKDETLAELYINFNNFRDSWSDSELKNIHFYPVNNRPDFTIKQDSLLGAFHQSIITNNLTVDKADKKLSIVLVKVTSKSELFSKYFAEVLANVVSKFYIETKTKKSANNVKILQHQTDSVRQQLNIAIDGVASSVDLNPNPNPSRQLLRTPGQRRQIDVQVNTAILAELVKNLEASKVSLRNEVPLIQVIDKPILPLKKDKLSRMKAGFLGAIIGLILGIGFFTAKKLASIILN